MDGCRSGTSPIVNGASVWYDTRSAHVFAVSHHVGSIALLPLENLSGTPEDGRLASGFAQDLISELARFPSLGVIAGESSFALNTTGLDDTRIAERLGAAYLLKGSVRRSRGAVRLSLQLLQAENGQHLWAERYDVPEEDVFALQDEVAAKVANALSVRIDQATLTESKRRPVQKLAAYECWLRGMECLPRGTIEADEEARGYFEQALKIDPTFARAHAGISLSHFNEWSCQTWQLWEQKEKLAYEHAIRAEALDANDPVVQLILGRIEQYRRDYDQAGPRLERALMLAPSDAQNLAQLAMCFAFQGESQRACELGRRSLRLNPLCPSWYFYTAALPLFTSGEYEEAIAVASRGAMIIVDHAAYVAAAHGYLGNEERAQFFLAEFHKQFVRRITGCAEPAPGEAMRWLLHVNPYRREGDSRHFAEGLRRAGLQSPGERLEKPVPVSWPIANIFRREGELWTMAFEHSVVQVPERRGFADIAKLLENPEQEMHCVSLAGVQVTGSSAGEVLDDRARRAYKTRLLELAEEIAECEENNDCARSERLHEEKERLLAEITKATGLGGRGRKLKDPAERARSAVTWRIRDAIKKLEPVHPTLARHLDNSIRTGVFCSYAPEREIRWFV
jgi:TolB-like protein